MKNIILFFLFLVFSQGVFSAGPEPRIPIKSVFAEGYLKRTTFGIMTYYMDPVTNKLTQKISFTFMNDDTHKAWVTEYAGPFSSEATYTINIPRDGKFYFEHLENEKKDIGWDIRYHIDCAPNIPDDWNRSIIEYSNIDDGSKFVYAYDVERSLDGKYGYLSYEEHDNSKRTYYFKDGTKKAVVEGEYVKAFGEKQFRVDHFSYYDPKKKAFLELRFDGNGHYYATTVNAELLKVPFIHPFYLNNGPAEIDVIVRKFREYLGDGAFFPVERTKWDKVNYNKEMEGYGTKEKIEAGDAVLLLNRGLLMTGLEFEDHDRVMSLAIALYPFYNELNPHQKKILDDVMQDPHMYERYATAHKRAVNFTTVLGIKSFDKQPDNVDDLLYTKIIRTLADDDVSLVGDRNGIFDFMMNQGGADWLANSVELATLKHDTKILELAELAIYSLMQDATLYKMVEVAGPVSDYAFLTIVKEASFVRDVLDKLDRYRKGVEDRCREERELRKIDIK